MRRRVFLTRLLICIIILVIILIPLGLVGFSTFRGHLMTKIFATLQMPPAAIEATKTELASVPQGLTGIGTIEAVRQVTVAPEAGGRVVSIFFESGAKVHANDPLVQLNDGPEQGDLANYQAQARNAEVNLTRAKKLVGRQFETQVNLDLNKAQLDEANGLIAKTRAQIAQKLIRAPFDGVLGIRQINIGQYLNAANAVVSLTDLDTLYLNFTLPEQDFRSLKLGQIVDITVDAYPGRTFKAQLTTIEPQVSTDTRAISVQATLRNPQHLLLPGMSANAGVELPPLLNQVVVPETAVDFSLYGDAVYTIYQSGTDAQGHPIMKARRNYVRTGDHFDNKVVIVSGLKPDELIAKSGQVKLSNDTTVVITSGDTLTNPATLPND